MQAFLNSIVMILMSLGSDNYTLFLDMDPIVDKRKRPFKWE